MTNMKKLILPVLMTVALVAGAGRVGEAQAQGAANHPDFSGKWAVDIQASSPGLVPDGGRLMQPFDVTPPTTRQPSFANAFTARQDSSTLRVQREVDRQGRPTILTAVYYSLDGSERTNIEGAMTKTVSTATWQNNTLRILTRVADPESLPQRKLERVMSLNANGRLLIDTTVGGDPTYRTVYRRVN